MSYVLYILIFYIGALCGSFVALAVHRMPLNQDVTHKRSCCPKCKHKWGFLDAIPIFSYIIFRGKCRHCKQKIKPTGFLIGILTGIIFVLFAASINFNLSTVTNISTMIYLGVGFIYLTIILIIAGIDEKYIMVDKSALIIGFIIASLYLIYQYVAEPLVDITLYRYVIYLVLACFLVLFSTIYLKKRGKVSYTLDILMLSICMVLYTYETVYIFTVAITLVAIIVQKIIQAIIKKSKKKKTVKGIKVKNTKTPIAFYMVVANMVALILINYSIFDLRIF